MELSEAIWHLRQVLKHMTPRWPVAASLRTVLDALEWRPISEAPKDGTEVLLFVPGGRPSKGRHAVKAALCKAFCDDLTVREVPAGLAVSTSFGLADGDKIGFYVITDRATGSISLQDSGLILPALEASGLDRKNKARAEALMELQSEYGVDLDEDDREFRIVGISEEALPGVALRFVAFLMRVHDLLLLVEEREALTSPS